MAATIRPERILRGGRVMSKLQSIVMYGKGKRCYKHRAFDARWSDVLVEVRYAREEKWRSADRGLLVR